MLFSCPGKSFDLVFCVKYLLSGHLMNVGKKEAFTRGKKDEFYCNQFRIIHGVSLFSSTSCFGSTSLMLSQ